MQVLSSKSFARQLSKHPGVLPDWEIEALGIVTPCAPNVRRPGIISYGLSSYGYDARLGINYKVFTNVYGAGVVDPKDLNPDAFISRTAEDFCIIPPNSFVLGETVEEFNIPRDVICVCVGKSTYARTGLIANVTPLEPEWRGKITVEISNTTPLPAKVYSNEGIIQILFFRASSQCDISYQDKRGKYQDQPGLTLPTVIKDT